MPSLPVCSPTRVLTVLRGECGVTGADGYVLNFHSASVHPTSIINRAYGFPVRCVQNLLLFKSKSLIRVEVSLIVKKAVTFYPASGYRIQTSGAFVSTGSGGWCWSCVLSGTNVLFLYFNSTVVNPTSSYYRACSFPVRCVQYLHQTF